VSVALPAGAVERTWNRTRVADALLLANVFTITWAQVRWAAGGADVNISDVTAAVFLVAA